MQIIRKAFFPGVILFPFFQLFFLWVAELDLHLVRFFILIEKRNHFFKNQGRQSKHVISAEPASRLSQTLRLLIQLFHVKDAGIKILVQGRLKEQVRSFHQGILMTRQRIQVLINADHEIPAFFRMSQTPLSAEIRKLLFLVIGSGLFMNQKPQIFIDVIQTGQPMQRSVFFNPVQNGSADGLLLLIQLGYSSGECFMILFFLFLIRF